MDSAKTSSRSRAKTQTLLEAQPAPRARAQNAHGFTLVELMMVVVILGILAAIAVPLYARYMYRSKTNEATAIMTEIERAQMAYYTATNRMSFYPASDNVSVWYPPFSSEAELGDSSVPWRTDPPNARWSNFLGAQPQNYATVYFRYQAFGGPPTTTPADVGLDDLGYEGNDAWWVTRAIADLDGDDDNVTFQRSSNARNTWVSNAAGWE